MKYSPQHLAEEYFGFLAKQFPVMCASDEFHFLPRAEAAAGYYDCLDHLSRESLEESLFQVDVFKKKFNQMAQHPLTEPDMVADLTLLGANAAGVEIELGEKRAWCHNPLLYLKVIFIGLDHALNKPAAEPEEKKDRFFARLGSAPDLLKQAGRNIVSIPDSYYKPALSMVKDCRAYLAGIIRTLSNEAETGITRQQEHLFDTCLTGLETFEKQLSSIKPQANRDFGAASVMDSMTYHFMSVRSLADVYDIAVEEWHETLMHLKTIQSRINPSKSWQELYRTDTPGSIEQIDIIDLYRLEAENLRHFFLNGDFDSEDLSTPMAVVETPSYLRSVRGTASFAAALRSDKLEKSYFYITTRLPGPHQKAEGALIRRFHREYKFLTAHESIPGHHLLDSVRRRLKNPVRRQIESPLFYEGWASYAESVLTENGYADTRLDRLVDYKRRLWRAARCQIDAGLSTGRIDREAAACLLVDAGFSQEEAVRQIDRFQLNPGYQLCYTLGRHEILRLKELYRKRIGDNKFHSFLLEGGELPFHLIEKKLAGMGQAG